MKEKRQDIILEQKLPWIIFGDGYMAQVTSIREIEDSTQKKMFKVTLRPMEELTKRYDISMDDLDENNQINAEYPIDSIHVLGSDPAWSVYLCLLNFEGDECEGTRRLNASNNMGVIQSLRDVMKRLKAENAYLKERLTLLETNTPEYIKEYVSNLTTKMSGINTTGPMVEGGSTQ
jgi:hypothetical protein